MGVEVKGAVVDFHKQFDCGTTVMPSPSTLLPYASHALKMRELVLLPGLSDLICCGLLIEKMISLACSRLSLSGF